MKRFLKCEKAAHICDKKQYQEAKFTERILLRVHLLLCGLCRTYSSKNHKLSKSIENADIKIIDQNKKQELKDRLNHEILKDK